MGQINKYHALKSPVCLRQSPQMILKLSRVRPPSTLMTPMLMKMTIPNLITMIMTMMIPSPGMMKHRANNKKRQTRRERRSKTTGEIRTESREKQEDHRVVRTKAEPQEQKERRVVRRVRSISPTTLDSRTVSLLCQDGEWVESEPLGANRWNEWVEKESPRTSSRASKLSSFCALQQPSLTQSLTSLPSLTTVSNISSSSRASFAYLTEDEDEEEREDEGLHIPSYNDLCYHILLRHQQDLQQTLLLNPNQPTQAEQLLLTNLALDHAPQRYPSLNSSTIVLRGEENTQHPVQVPLWSPGAPRLRQGSGLQKKSTGLKSTERQLLQQNCSKE